MEEIVTGMKSLRGEGEHGTSCWAWQVGKERVLEQGVAGLGLQVVGRCRTQG